MKRIILNLILALAFLPAFVSAQCYTVIESNTGIPSIYTDGLDQRACDLLTLVNGFVDDDNQAENATNCNFEVLGCDFYPVLAYVSQVDGFDRLFATATIQLDATKESYAMVTKEHNVDGTVAYRTHIKFPTCGNFEKLTPFEKAGINSLFLTAIDSAAVNKNPEEEGLTKLSEIFADIIADTFDLGGASMKLAGFDSAPVKSSESFTRPTYGSDGSPYLPPTNNPNGNVVYDWTGLEVPGSKLSHMISNNIDPDASGNEGLRPFYAMASLSHAYIITDDNNTIAELEAAEATFKGDKDSKVLIWMHFSLDEVETHQTTDSVYIQYGDNLTFEDAEAIINEMFNYYMSLWLPDHFNSQGPIYTYDKEGTPTLRNSALLDCKGQEETCDLGWKWGATCLMPRIGGTDGWFSNIPGGEFGGGLAVGLFDGLLGTIHVFYEAGKGVKDISTGWWESITSYIGELVQTAIASGSLLAVAQKVLGDTVAAIKAAWNKVVDIFKVLHAALDGVSLALFKDVVQGMWNAVKDWMGSLLSGDKCPAYDVGVLCFDLILTAFTGGSAAGATFLPKILNWIKTLKTASYNAASKLMAGVTTSASKVSGLANKILKCKILGKGCFVGNTPVLMAYNPFKIPNAKSLIVAATMPLVMPIQDVTVDDMVKSFHHENYAATALNGDDIYIPDWQSYDYLDITPNNWQIGKFIIKDNDGSIVEVQLNRPKKWFKERGIEKIGDQSFLYVPDANISGNAELLELKPTIIDTRTFVLNEEKQIDRPVISTFKRYSPIVYDYIFSDSGKIGATPEHPFFSIDRQDYVLAKDLYIGELVKSSSNKEIRFVEARFRKKGEFVYNFEVWREHNYYVSGNDGKDFVLVHNTYGVLTRVGNFIHFKNPSGIIIKFKKQTSWSETKIINKRNAATSPDEILELDAALKLKQSGIDVKAIGYEAKTSPGHSVGEIDIWTNKGMVEVKTNVGDLKVSQMKKYMDPTDPNFINPSKADNVSARKITVYTKNGSASEIAAKKAEILEALGEYKNVFDFEITNSLDDLADLMNN